MFTECKKCVGSGVVMGHASIKCLACDGIGQIMKGAHLAAGPAPWLLRSKFSARYVRAAESVRLPTRAIDHAIERSSSWRGNSGRYRRGELDSGYVAGYVVVASDSSLHAARGSRLLAANILALTKIDPSVRGVVTARWSTN
jgi:hypothetical protein